MAERRMFSKTIIDSDAFLDMPLSAQCLYFHLSMRADDEGFVNNPKKIVRMVNASEDDLRLLIAKKFIITFDNGIVVIKHWRIHNYIRKDRKVDTNYTDERMMLSVEENGSYRKLDCNKIPVLDVKCQASCQPSDNQMSTVCQPSDNQVTTNCQPNVSIGKDSIGKYNNIILSDDNICPSSARQAVRKWNDELAPLGVKPIRKLASDSQRYIMFSKRLKEYGSDAILEAIDEVKASKFLRQSRFFDFGWFVRPENFAKVIEGKYRDADTPNVNRSDAYKNNPTAFAEY